MGVNFIDTADSYGPFTAELLIKKALNLHADDLVIATQAELSRQGPDSGHRSDVPSTCAGRPKWRWSGASPVSRRWGMATPVLRQPPSSMTAARPTAYSVPDCP